MRAKELENVSMLNRNQDIIIATPLTVYTISNCYNKINEHTPRDKLLVNMEDIVNGKVESLDTVVQYFHTMVDFSFLE